MVNSRWSIVFSILLKDRIVFCPSFYHGLWTIDHGLKSNPNISSTRRYYGCGFDCYYCADYFGYLYARGYFGYWYARGYFDCC